MSGGFFRGTSADQDTRFSNKQAKLLKSQKFAPELDQQVDVTKVKMDLIRPWIATRATELLGFEDEVLINFVYGLLDAKEVDGKQIQIQLTGFMEKHTAKFMKELWSLLLSAQKNSSGVPQQFLDAKQEEIRKKKEEDDRIAQEIQRRREKDGIDLQSESRNPIEAGPDRLRSTSAVLDSTTKHEIPSVPVNHVDEENPVDERHDLKTKRHDKYPKSNTQSPSPDRSSSRSLPLSKRRHAKSRSISCSSRSRSPSVSPARRNLSPRFRSPQRRLISPRRRHSPRKTRSPTRKSPRAWRQSPLRPRHRSPSPLRRRSPYPRQTSISPPRYQSPPPRYRASPSHRRTSGRSHRRSISPPWYRSRRLSPARRPSPSRRKSPLNNSPSPRRYRSPSPRRLRSPSPRRHRSPITRWRRSQSPRRRRSPSPRRRSPLRQSSSPKRRRTPSPRKTSPSPPRKTSPSLRYIKQQKGSTSPPSRNRTLDPQLVGRHENRSRSPVRSRSPPYRIAGDNQHNNGLKSSRMQSPRSHEKRPPANLSSKKDFVRIPDPRDKISDSVARLPLASPVSSQNDSSDGSDSVKRIAHKKNLPRRSVSPSGKPRIIPRTKSMSGSPVRQEVRKSHGHDTREMTGEEDEIIQSRESAHRKFSSSKKREMNISSNEVLLPASNSRPINLELQKKTQEKSAIDHNKGNRARVSPPSEDLEYGPGAAGKEWRMFDDKVKKSSLRDRVVDKNYLELHDSGHESLDDKKNHHKSKKNMDKKKWIRGSLSDSDDANARDGTVEERRRIKSSSKRNDSDDDSQLDDRKEAKRRRKEEKRQRKEERQRRRKERHQRKLERRSGKPKLKYMDTETSPSDLDRGHSDMVEKDVHASTRGESVSDAERSPSEQKKLEIELRKKALESLRAKKAISN